MLFTLIKIIQLIHHKEDDVATVNTVYSIYYTIYYTI